MQSIPQGQQSLTSGFDTIEPNFGYCKLTVDWTIQEINLVLAGWMQKQTEDLVGSNLKHWLTKESCVQIQLLEEKLQVSPSAKTTLVIEARETAHPTPLYWWVQKDSDHSLSAMVAHCHPDTHTPETLRTSLLFGAANPIPNYSLPYHPLDLLANVINVTNDAVWERYIPTETFYFSPRCYEILGMEPYERPLDWEFWGTHILPDDFETVMKEVNACINGECEGFDFTYSILIPNGELRWIRARGKIIERDSKGQGVRLIGANQDVTETKQLLKRLDEGQERLKRAIEGNRDGIWDWHIPSDTLYISARSLGMIGFTEDEITDSVRFWDQRIHPDDYNAAHFSLSNHLRGMSEEYRSEYRIQHKDGHWIWIHARGKVVERDASGMPVHLSGTHTNVTARKQVEQALQRSEERLNLVLQATHVGMWDWNISKNTYYFSNTCYKLLGIKPEEIGLTIDLLREWTNPRDLDRIQAALDEHLQGKSAIYDVTYRMVNQAKETIWVSSLGSVVSRDPVTNQPTRMIGILQNVTQKVAMEQQLVNQQNQIQLALDCVGIGFWDWNLMNHSLYCDHRIAHITGLELNDTFGNLKAINSRVVDEDKPHVARVLKAHLAGEQSLYNVEFRFIKPDGSLIWLGNSGRVIEHDDAGNPTRMMGVLQDITERVHMEEEAKRMSQFSIDSTSEAIFWVDSEAQFIHVNQAACRLTGYTRDELTTMKVYDIDILFTEENWPTYWNQLREKHKSVFETSLSIKSGCLIPVEIRIDFCQIDGKEYNCAVVRDISLQQQAERELIAARESAVRASKMKSQFLANMSHEIRTPMHGILGMAELLLHSTLSPEQAFRLNIIRSSADSLLGIINDILDFSKIEAGKIDFEIEPFHLRDNLNRLLEPFRLQAKDKGLQLNCAIDSRIPDGLIGDFGRTAQVLNNLIHNAIKFTERGSITIHLEPDELTQNTITLTFKVTDTGIGIPQAAQDKIFEPFTQVDGSPSREYHGTGLGLSISRQLINLMGGELSLDSRAGLGSTFRFTLTFQLAPTQANSGISRDKPPLSADNNKPLETSASLMTQYAADSPPAAPEQCRWSDLPILNVLLVEDHDVNQLVIASLLEPSGWKIAIAADGIEALSWLEKNKADLVLMDIHMPRMDGYEVTMRIRAEEHKKPSDKRMPIIALTANVQEGERERCLQAGMDAYLSKPFTQRELFNTISQVLETLAKEPRMEDKIQHPDTSTSGRSLIDMGRLMMRYDGNKQFIVIVINAFLESTPRLMTAAEQAIQQNNGDQLWQELHKLKASIAYLTQESPYEKANSLEALAKEGNWPAIHTLYASLKQDLKDMERFCQDYMLRQSPATTDQASS